MMSHDLRSPLAVATGHIELLQEALDHPSIDEIRGALARTEEIVEDTLTWARTGAAVKETGRTSISTVAQAAWNLVPTPGLELVVETDRAIEADESRLQQLLENLFRNAHEHGGQARRVTVGALDDGFFVEDDGVGFPGDASDRLFQIGETTSRKGTGFGLSIAKQITDAHGWSIDAVTARQGGARLEITGVEWASDRDP